VGIPFVFQNPKKIKPKIRRKSPRFPAGRRALPKADPANSSRMQQGFGVKK
jgi:hypothetical protein